MAEYIEREALKNDGHICFHDGKGNVYYEVDHAPTADVVEVVRCKDCKYCEIHYPVREYGGEAIKGYYCNIVRGFRAADYFCASGRKG